MNKKKRDKSRQFVNKTKPKALFLCHTIKLHIFAKDKLHLGIACKQACIYALSLLYLCKRYEPTQFFIHLKNIITYGN